MSEVVKNSMINVRRQKIKTIKISFILLIVVGSVIGYLIFNNNEEIYERPVPEYTWDEPVRVTMTVEYASFEEALTEATNIVVAQYVESNDVSITVSGERHYIIYRPE